MFSFNFIRACWFTPTKSGWGLPLFFNGQPGVGKSEALEGYAKRCGLHTKVLLGSLMDPTDLGGMPVPERNYVRYLPAQWVQKLNEHEDCLLFLDEFRSCPLEVQAAMLRVVLDRVVGEVTLMRGVRIVAAANPVEQTAGGHDLTPPMNNRFIHLHWRAPDAKAFSAYQTAGGSKKVEQELDPRDEQARVLRAWPTEYSKAVGLITAFVNKRPDLLTQEPPKDGAPAYATPRSWEMAQRILATSKIHNLDASEQSSLLMGCLGEGTAVEFAGFCENADLPDIADLLDGKVKFKHSTKKPDRTYAVMSAAAAMVANDDCENRADRINQLYGMISTIADARPDLVLNPFQTLTGLYVQGADDRLKSEILKKYFPILESAEITKG